MQVSAREGRGELLQKQPMRKPLAVLCYLLSAAIFVFCCAVLWRGLHPVNMSPEYKSFYLDKLFANWPGENGLALQPGTTYAFTDADPAPGVITGHLSRGEWDYAPPDRYSIREKSASLYFTRDCTQTLAGEVQLSSAVLPQTVTLLVDGEQAAVFVLTEAAQTFSFAVPAVPDEEMLKLSFVVEDGQEWNVLVNGLVLR